jgi:hypothetical protein
MPKSVVISSLAMRFYEKHGWTKELLESYLLRGTLTTFPQDIDPYWILEPYSQLDVERLVADGHVGELVCSDLWGELKGMTDLEILKQRNW